MGAAEEVTECVVDPTAWSLADLRVEPSVFGRPDRAFWVSARELARTFLEKRDDLQRADAAAAVGVVCNWLSESGGWQVRPGVSAGQIYWDHLWEGGLVKGFEPEVMVNAVVRFLYFLEREGRISAEAMAPLHRQALQDGLAWIAVCGGLLTYDDVRDRVRAACPRPWQV